MFSFIYYNLVWFCSGFITGLTAFGGNLVAVPLITLAMDPRDAIIFGCLSCSAIFTSLAIIYRKGILWRETVIVVVCAWLGAPLGSWFLEAAGPKALLLAAGVSISLFLLWQLIARHLRKSQKPLAAGWALPLGLLSGIMMGGVSMGGPPLALYAFLRHWDKHIILGTINAISIGIMLPILPWQWHIGLLTPNLLTVGLICGVTASLGIMLSVPVANRLNTAIFRRMLLGMLAVSAFILLGRGLMA